MNLAHAHSSTEQQTSLLVLLCMELMKPASQVTHQEISGFAFAKVNIDNAFLSSCMLSVRLTWLDEITNHSSGDKNLDFTSLHN